MNWRILSLRENRLICDKAHAREWINEDALLNIEGCAGWHSLFSRMSFLAYRLFVVYLAILQYAEENEKNIIRDLKLNDVYQYRY